MVLALLERLYFFDSQLEIFLQEIVAHHSESIFKFLDSILLQGLAVL